MYHGYASFILTLYWHFAALDTTCSKKNSDLELFIMVSSAAHFFWDLIYMKYHGILEFGNLLHHSMGLSSYYFGAYSQRNMNMLVMNLLPAELTNFNMHIREVLKRIGWRYTWIYYVNEYLYSYLYIFCRAIWIPAIAYWVYTCDTINPIVVIFYPVHILQGLYYVSLLPKMIRVRTTEIKKIEEHMYKLSWTNPIDPKVMKELKIGTFEPYSN
jgi:hypothetical protein